jgi:hypothetical protein
LPIEPLNGGTTEQEAPLAFAAIGRLSRPAATSHAIIPDVIVFLLLALLGKIEPSTYNIGLIAELCR